jgi:hypothetical protein
MSDLTFEPPIQDVTVFDILGERKDGGIDAAIVVATPLDGSPETLRILAQKIRNYVTELSSADFLAEYPRVPNSSVRIIIMCHGPVDAAAYGLISAMRGEVQAAGILLEVEHCPPSNNRSRGP